MSPLAGGLVTGLLLLFSVWVHKVGHALAYRDLGIGRAVVRYGAPLGPRMVRQPTGDRPWGVVVTPWLVTGHVQPAVTAELAGTLAYPDLALYASGGVILSLVTGCGLLAGWAFTSGGATVWPALGWAAVCGAGWAWRRHLAAVLCATGPLVLLGSELWAVAGGLHERGAHGLMSLVEVRSFSGALFAGGVLSLTAGIFSMLPLSGFDGGAMLRVGVGLWRKDRAQAVYSSIQTAVIVTVLAIAVLADVLGGVG